MWIADATEAMAANYNQMRTDKELYERWCHGESEKTKELQASNSALQGVITRMKNKAKKSEQTGS